MPPSLRNASAPVSPNPSATSFHNFELLLERITEKFTESVGNIIKEFNSLITQVIDVKFEQINSKIKQLQDSFQAAGRTSHGEAGNHSGTDGGKPVNDLATITESVAKSLMEVEKQKEELKLRAKNIIISGLEVAPHMSDKDGFEEFCEQNLTIKPRVVKTRRPKQKGSNLAKLLCITLESAEAAEALLDSARILRTRENPQVKKVFFNKDLTREQREAAYRNRCARRLTNDQKSRESSAPSQNNFSDNNSNVLPPPTSPFSL